MLETFPWYCHPSLHADDFATPPPAKKPKERKQVSKTRPEGSGPTLTTAGSEEPSTTAARGRCVPKCL